MGLDKRAASGPTNVSATSTNSIRATRTGPDSLIDPAQQTAFYDPGLGSSEIPAGGFWTRTKVSLRKFISSAFGAGLMRNVADCYEAILKEYRPGDRIFLFGFSRGAYTVRTLAGVMNLCGVPIKDAAGKPLPRAGRALRAIVDEAVHGVYEHGAGRDRAKFEAQREELARRFRIKYGTQDDPIQNRRGNVVPYFVGVFDTVAALGMSSPKLAVLIVMGAAALVAFAAFVGSIANWVLGISLLKASIAVAAIALGLLLAYGYMTRVKVIHNFPVEGASRRHISAWHFKFYDRYLDPRIRYARHAQAIDETRKDFTRVGWGNAQDQDANPDDWLRQIWFAGNHSDIGGSYEETESRLSDIALGWMVEQCVDGAIPNGIVVDRTKLILFGDPSGPQHCEVAATLDRYPSWWPKKFRRGWESAPRTGVSVANLHPTVRQRFDLAAVECCGITGPYRPEALRNEPELATYYASVE